MSYRYEQWPPILIGVHKDRGSFQDTYSAQDSNRIDDINTTFIEIRKRLRRKGRRTNCNHLFKALR